MYLDEGITDGRCAEVEFSIPHQSASAAKGEMCKRCAGYGSASADIDECPMTICDPCGGTGAAQS